MNVSRTGVLLLVLLLGGSVVAVEHHYRAELHQAAWSVTASRVECTLGHEVPEYGTARFFQRAGGEFGLELFSPRDTARPGTAQLASLPPDWNHGAVARELGEVALAPGTRPFAVDRDLALRVLLELEQGMTPTFSFGDWADARDQVQVALSPVNFRAALQAFLSCSGQLLEFGLDAVQGMRIYFDVGTPVLTAADQARLDRVARYVRADQSVTWIEVEGYADYVGRRQANQLLSQARADAVREYLLRQGVPPERVGAYGRGELPEVGAEGRARSRRVEIRIVR